MTGSGEVEDSDEAPSALIETSAGTVKALPAADPRPDVQAEVVLWQSLGRDEQWTAFRDVIAGSRAALPETMVRMCRHAHLTKDRAILNLAFEALSKIVTPSLLARAWGLTPEDRSDQAQQILLELFAAIRAGKSGLAENKFAAFAKRRAVSLYRKRMTRFEGVNQRIEPTEDDDPVDSLPDRIPSAEARALLSVALDKLSPDHRAVFIQYHLLKRTQEEIAAAKGVDVTTVRAWLKKAGEAVGLKGEKE